METTGTGTGASRGSVMGKVCYEAYLPALSLSYGGNLCIILVGAVLLTVQDHVFSKNLHL